MRSLRAIVPVALMLFIVSAACKFFSTVTPGPTSEPSPYIDDSSLKFDPAELPEAQKDIPYQVEVKVENVLTFVGEFTIEKGELPPGLSLERVPSENAARLVGTPQETGTFSFVLGVWCEGTNDPGQTGQKEYTIVVK